MKKMTEKLALQIAYNILCDELDTQDEEYGYGTADTEYYQEIKDTAEKIKEMVSHR